MKALLKSLLAILLAPFKAPFKAPFNLDSDEILADLNECEVLSELREGR